MKPQKGAKATKNKIDIQQNQAKQPTLGILVHFRHFYFLYGSGGSK